MRKMENQGCSYKHVKAGRRNLLKLTWESWKNKAVDTNIGKLEEEASHTNSVNLDQHSTKLLVQSLQK